MKDYIQVTLTLKRQPKDYYTTNGYTFTYKGEERKSTLSKVMFYMEDISEITSINMDELDGFDIQWKRGTITM